MESSIVNDTSYTHMEPSLNQRIELGMNYDLVYVRTRQATLDSLTFVACLMAEKSRCTQKNKPTRNLDCLLLCQDVTYQHLVRSWGSRLLTYHYYYSFNLLPRILKGQYSQWTIFILAGECQPMFPRMPGDAVCCRSCWNRPGFQPSLNVRLAVS